ncbi:unnamed protein product, partial [Tetraodon nigroviridis]
LEDLQGAAKGLMRLQDVYCLQVSSLVRGQFQRVAGSQSVDVHLPAVSVQLSGDDCFLVGKVAYDQEDYYHSVHWLEESVRLFRRSGSKWSPENEGTLHDALDHLAFSHFKLRRSVVATRDKQVTAEYRISKSAWLKGSAQSAVSRLDQRISMLTGLNVQHPHGEYLQVVNYGIGGHYEPHFDHATSPSSPVFKLKTGNRVATVMIYLSSVEAGGSTAFIYANFSVPVMKNAAIFWWNLHRNGRGDPDTLHAGCPVLIGDKWVANKWIHEYGQEFLRRCSLNPEE